MSKTKNITSPMTALVTNILVKQGQQVRKDEELVILEAMKMENAIKAPEDAIIEAIEIEAQQTVNQNDVLIRYRYNDKHNDNNVIVEEEKSHRHISELRKRRGFLTDDNRPNAVEKRLSKSQNTARENVALLVDSNSFKEYGGLVVAAQRSRRSIEDLIKNTPADGLVSGTATINANQYGKENSRCLVMAYDYTVLAGTQGTMNHMKMDRMLALARKEQLPTILFAEGGGGRPGDVDVQTVAGLFINTFHEYAALSEEVPTIAIVSGYCFAGNAALAGSSNIIIGTKNISIGMGGPAMIEGGGLGLYHPKEVGPAEIQSTNGVIDILVEDETEAVSVAKKYLSYHQGSLSDWECSDQEDLQTFIPDNRKRTYDIFKLIALLADKDSVLYLREQYGKGLITAFIRIEGEALGVIANNSAIDAGAITSENGIKAQDFLNLCDKGGIPVLSLIDTPGIMVGPEAEQSGTVKHASKIFNVAAKMTVPYFSIVIRKAYGLGAMAMMGGSTHFSNFTIAWPTGEFGAMGLEGAVRLGYRKELEAVIDEQARAELFDTMVEEAYERGKALNMATMFEIDNVIEPKETRAWISSALNTKRK